MKSPAAFERLSLSDKLKELYRMVRQAIAKNSTPSGVIIPTQPETGTHTLKSVEGVLTWVEDAGA